MDMSIYSRIWWRPPFHWLNKEVTSKLQWWPGAIKLCLITGTQPHWLRSLCKAGHCLDLNSTQRVTAGLFISEDPGSFPRTVSRGDQRRKSKLCCQRAWTQVPRPSLSVYAVTQQSKRPDLLGGFLNDDFFKKYTIGLPCIPFIISVSICIYTFSSL